MTQVEVVRQRLESGEIVSPRSVGINKQSLSAVVSSLRKRERLEIVSIPGLGYQAKASEPRLEPSIETVTPSKAKQWLEGNTHNRTVSPRLVDIYAETILAGEWKLNGEPIIFDRDGVLQSGQHRLLAVIEAGKSIRSLVVRGAEPQSLYSLDSGRKRRLADVLTLRGEKDVNTLGSALSWLWRYQSGNMTHLGATATNVQLLKLLDQTPGLRDSIAEMRRTKPVLHFSPGVLAALHYEMSLIDEEDTASFFEGIISGTDLKAGDPRLALIHWAHRTKLNKARRPSPVMIAAVVVKAWNAYRDHRTVKILAFKPSEKFPEIY